MSFSINGPDNIPSIQKSHHTNDGGAGNLGYFQQEKKKKDEDKEENDVFEFSSKENENDKENDEELNDVGDKIKTFWLKIHGLFSETVYEKQKKPET